MEERMLVEYAWYCVCGERMRVLAWDVDNGADNWLILHDAATDEPRYLVQADRLERIERQPDRSLRSFPCDVTLEDVLPVGAPHTGNSTR